MHLRQGRSSHRRCSIKIGALNRCNIYRKTLVLKSPFNKVTDLQASNFVKTRLEHSCFPVIIAKFLKTLVSKIICKRQLLTGHKNHICFLFVQKCLLPKPNFPSFRFLYFLLEVLKMY